MSGSVTADLDRWVRRGDDAFRTGGSVKRSPEREGGGGEREEKGG